MSTRSQRPSCADSVKLPATPSLEPTESEQKNSENQSLMEQFAVMKADMAKMKIVMIKQQEQIKFLERLEQDTRNKFKIVRNATSGILELLLGMFKRLLSRANDVPEPEFNILQWSCYDEIWCVECLTKFKINSCKNYTGSAPTCPVCLPIVKLEKLQLSSKAHNNLQAFAGDYGKPKYIPRPPTDPDKHQLDDST